MMDDITDEQFENDEYMYEEVCFEEVEIKYEFKSIPRILKYFCFRLSETLYTIYE